MPLFPGTSTTLAKGKRAREEDEAKVEAWADEDIELVRAVSRPTTGEVVSNLESRRIQKTDPCRRYYTPSDPSLVHTLLESSRRLTS